MGNAQPDAAPTPSILQEAIDTIAREFGYPDEFVIEYDASESDRKRTQFTVSLDGESEDDVLVLTP